MLRIGVIAITLRFCFFAYGEDVSQTPAVEKIGEHRYRLGVIEFDAKTREVSVPVTVNMREGGPLEYVLVHETGKVHESIFATAVSPLDLQVVMKLVKYKTGDGDVFNALLPAADIEKNGGKIEDRGEAVTFAFRPDGEEEIAVAETVIDGFENAPIDDGEWIFTGSSVERGDFMAEIEGSIIAIYLDRFAMFNMARAGSDNDDRWGANDKLIPEIGTEGTLLIRTDGANEPVKSDAPTVSE